MDTKKVPMTTKGYQRLHEELRHLKTVERPQVVESIAQAREHGDLSENAEYHAARERQGFIEGRIAELEYKLGMAEVIDVSILSGSDIKFGASVSLIDDDTDESSSYQLVGSDESDVRKGFLSITSPLAKALIGKTIGDSIEVNVPSGTKVYTVTHVGYEG
jgi:transcription elongation factor GreA